MTRKQFLANIAKTGAAAATVGVLPTTLNMNSQAVAASEKIPAQDFVGKRMATEHSAHIAFPPEKVFPLLCPVREYDWIEGWACQMIYSKSGVAEENCIFTTSHTGHLMVWNCNRYEPPTRIEFVTVASGHMVTRLNISLERISNGTNLRWERIFTGLSEEGNAAVGTWKTERDEDLSRRLEYYLKTGTMQKG